MYRKVLMLIVVALVGVTTAVAAKAAAATKPSGCGQLTFLGHGAEYWNHEVNRLLAGKIPPLARWPKRVYSSTGCGILTVEGHGAEWWHADFVRQAIRLRKVRAARPTNSGSFGARIVSIARRYIGVPYRWGGTTPSGFDCSGLVQFVFRQVGKRLPRTTWQQERDGHRVSRLAIGDVVFLLGGEHVGIYIGGGRIIDAPHTGATVGIRALSIFGGYVARSFA